MSEIVWAIIIGYLLYKLIFELILPVGKATSQVRSQIKKMQTQQEELNKRQQQKNKQETPKPDISEEDYIDFEEIKD